VECFVEQGISYNDCLSKIIAKHGDRIQIVTQRDIRIGGFFGLFTQNGVEIEFYVPQHFSKVFAGYGQNRMAGSVPLAASVLDTGDSKNPEPPKKPLDFEESKKRVLEAAGKDSTQMMILKEVRTIKEKLDTHEAAARQEEHPSLTQIAELLTLNDFSASYVNAILERGRKELTLETLDNFNEVQNKVLEWVGETVHIYQEPKNHKLPRIMVLVGPTGVGKTTTIAKLAAFFGLGNRTKNERTVRMITIDAFRIGARAQIEKYGEIMGFPVAYVDNYRDLKKEIALASEGVDMVLVDTIGKSPRDSADLGEMKELLNACGYYAEVYLVISATVKSSDIHEILRQFEPFNYRSIILTKLDETTRLGNVICALAEKEKTLAYITDGQKVPADIHRASVVRFLLSMEGFQVDRKLVEKQFPGNEAE
jgi:flagellar biosynthesis protein FlhF